jgi:uncharacterized OsmC-like protein
MCGLGLAVLTGSVVASCMIGPHNYLTAAAVIGCIVLAAGSMMQHRREGRR